MTHRSLRAGQPAQVRDEREHPLNGFSDRRLVGTFPDAHHESAAITVPERSRECSRNLVSTRSPRHYHVATNSAWSARSQLSTMARGARLSKSRATTANGCSIRRRAGWTVIGAPDG
jgi:hypothetical protein